MKSKNKNSSQLGFAAALPALLFFIFSNEKLAAQCDRVAWVAANDPNCGVKIIDLQTSQVLRAVAGAADLEVFKTISFTAAAADPLPTCSNDPLPTVALTCVSDKIPCKADFVPFQDDADPMTWHFSAQLLDPAAQTCSWDFGDGSMGAGQEAMHTFAAEGNFQIHLTVHGDGCEATKSVEIEVSKKNAANCGFDLQVTVVGKTLMGKVVPVAPTAGNLKEVSWYFSKTNIEIAQTADFQYVLPDFGNYNVCAEVVSERANGSTCAFTSCRPIGYHPAGCTDPEILNKDVLCPVYFAPVCGCDGVTYGNECEAIASGVTTWWAGKCASGGSPCSADAVAQIVEGSPDDGFLARFHNLAKGDFTFLQLDYGDGSPILQTSNWDSIDHRYNLAGTYLANLTVWKKNGCVSSMTKLIQTDWATSQTQNPPLGTEYVLPGDANGDRKANVYDLLNVGLGYFAEGAPRPDASGNFTPQLAANWTDELLNGLNFKHLDCDGNGRINELDPTLIRQNYTPIDSSEVVFNPALPKIWLDFSSNPDTIFIDPNNPKPLEISADVMVASVAQPVFDLYGLGFAVKYPLFVNQDPEVNYYDNSNFGFSNDILWMPKNNFDRKQLDLGFVRKNGVGKNGYFKLARINFKTDFVIIVDIVYRDAAAPKPFVAGIKGLRAIDSKGVLKMLSLPASLDTIWVKLQQTIGTSEAAVAQLLDVFPNPSLGEATLLAGGDLKIEAVEVLNVLGQKVENLPVSDSKKLIFQTSGWSKGIYTLRVRTDKGLGEKRLVVK